MKAPPHPPLSPATLTPLPAELAWSGLTHCGRVRPNNEDAFLGLAFDRHDIIHLGKTGRASLAMHDLVFAVSDGMGGARAGEFASRIAVDRITRLLPRGFRRAGAGPDEALGELFAAIHHDLLQLGQSYEECADMGATLSLAWFTPGQMAFAHVGDSRIYHLPAAGGRQQLTHDHTHVGWLRRNGQVNEREAREHPRRNALNQVLGAGQQLLDPQFGVVAHQPGDRFLLCTDGLVDGLWDHRLEEIIREPGSDGAAPTTAARLIEAALAQSGRDNLTAVVVEVAG